jgi:hypothetical protein
MLEGYRENIMSKAEFEHSTLKMYTYVWGTY